MFLVRSIPTAAPTWSKEQLLAFADEFVANHLEADNDMVDLLIQAAKVELVLTRIKEQAKIMAMNEVRQHGKAGLFRAGITLTVKEVGVHYDYSLDPQWQELNREATAAIDTRKAHEAYLKVLPHSGRIQVDEATGDTYKAYPPAKRGGDGIQISIQ